MFITFQNGVKMKLARYQRMQDIGQVCYYINANFLSVCSIFADPEAFKIVNIKGEDGDVWTIRGYDRLVSIELQGGLVRVSCAHSEEW